MFSSRTAPLFVLLVGLYGMSFGLAKEASIAVTVHVNKDDRDVCEAKIKDVLNGLFKVRSVTFSSDIALQETEFSYLVDIPSGDVIDHKKIAQAVYYLSKKQKFETIVIHIDRSDDQIGLHFELSSFWTLKKLKFKGIFVGKDYYRQYYSIAPGEPFDMKKHNDAVKKITELLKRDGYFNVFVDVQFLYDYKTKSVAVCLRICKGPRFAIGSAQVTFDSSLLNAEQEYVLSTTVQDFFVRPLLKNWYNRDFINNQTVALRNFLLKKNFLHIDIDLEERVIYTTRRIELYFTVHLHYQKNFQFIGNQFYSHNQLQDLILAFGRSASLLPLSIVSEEIMRAYHEKGFWNVSVEPKEENGICSFVINEGSRARIVAVELRNLTNFNAKKIAKRFFDQIFANYYDATVLSRSIDQLLMYFFSSGFWKSSLLHRSCELVHAKKNQYKLVLTFDEGVRSLLQSVKINGYEELESHGPFKRFYQLAKPVPFDVTILDEQRQWLQQYFHKEGYYQPKVKPQFDKQEGEINVTWQVDLGNAQLAFGKTVVLDAQTFPFQYIQRELEYKVGDHWHSNALRHSVSRLQKLDIFESVHLFPDKDADQEKEQVMLLKLQMDDPFELRLRTGIGVQHVTKSLTTGGGTYRLGGSFIWKNPANRADQLRCDADFTRAIRLVNLQYRIPWIFSLPVNAMMQGYTNRYEYPGFIGSQKNLYTVIQQGFLVNFAHLSNNVNLSLNGGFEVINTVINESKGNECFAKDVARAINFRYDLFDKNIPFFVVQPTCILFYLDNTVNPTRGLFSVLSIKGMFPVAKLNAASHFYIRMLWEQSLFIPCLPVVFAIRFRVGHLFHSQFDTVIPIERFYLGGANSIRSYETDQCPPLGSLCDCGQTLYVAQGGKSLANMNIEMKFPLFQKFSGVLFTDIGALSNNRLTDIKAENCLSGIGFGLRYDTAIGPLRFDFAWRGNKHDGIGRPYAWFVSLGNAFI